MASWQDRILDDKNNIWNQGQNLDQFNADAYNQSGGRADYYRQLADQYYNDLRDNGGYSPDQIQQIMQSQGYDSLLRTGQQNNDSFLTPDEIQEMRGDPYAAKNAYNSDGTFQALGEGNNNRRGQWTSASGGVQSALDRYKEGMNAAIDPSIALDPNFAGRGQGYIDQGTGARTGALERGYSTAQDIADPLKVSDRYTNAATVGDSEVRDIEQNAANQVRAGNQRAVLDAQQRALQGGNSNALAVGAFQRDMANDSAPAEAEAATAARLKASDYRRSWEDRLEDKNLGAAGNRAQIESQGLDFLKGQSDVYGDDMNARLNLNQNTEGMRQDQLEKLMNARMGAAQGYGTAAVNEQQQNRAGGAQIEGDIADKNYDAQYQDQMNRVALEQQGEDRANQRATGIMQNQQNTRQTNQDRTYNQNMGIYDRYSGNYRQNADAQRQDRQVGGQYTAGQLNTNYNNQNQAADRRQQGYGIQTQGVNQANSVYSNSRNQPGFWGKLTGGLIGAAGAVSGMKNAKVW